MEVLATNINSLYKAPWNTIHSLKQEIENVSKAEQTKVYFLRSASHELKTPLMSIHIMLENMMLNIGKYKNHDVYLPKCKDAVIDLSNMVQEILDTSRLETWNTQNEYKIININIYFNNNSLIIENECEPIPKEHLERIFEAFYRAEFDRNRNTGGNGLGLYIVRQILNTLDIAYSFNATERGMKFTMTFK